MNSVNRWFLPAEEICTVTAINQNLRGSPRGQTRLQVCQGEKHMGRAVKPPAYALRNAPNASQMAQSCTAVNQNLRGARAGDSVPNAATAAKVAVKHRKVSNIAAIVFDP